MRKKQKTYWAAYSGKHVGGCLFVKSDGSESYFCAVFRTRREAKKIYSDVRKVTITEVKPKRKK